MDEDEHRIVHLDRIHETDRRGVVDGQSLDHLHLAGLKIDRAVNVDGLTPGRLFNREVLLARHPAAGGARAMGWLNRVRERHRWTSFRASAMKRNKRPGDAYDRALFEELAPAANRGVVKEQRLGDPLSRSTKAFARRVTRQGGRPVAPQRSRRLAIFFAEEAGLNHARNRIRPITNRKNFSRLFNEPRYK
jgi:hypothetical protein